MGRIKDSIVLKSILGIVLILVVFTFIVGIIGYQGFTEALLDRYADDAFRTADIAALSVEADRMDDYINSGGVSAEYQSVRDSLDHICNAAGAAFVYVICPDVSDYDHITFVFSTHSHESDYPIYDFGYVRETTNEEYREKYRLLYEEGADRELVVRDRGYIETDPHITVMVPLKDSTGQTRGILCVQRQMEIMVSARNAYIWKILLAMVFLAVIVVIGESIYQYRMFLLPIKRITDETERFAEENIRDDKKLADIAQTRDEIGTLARSVDHMEDEILRYITRLTQVTAEKERISAELGLARTIQSSQLPHIYPAFPEHEEFELYASMTPAREVGGDFYDFFLIDDDHVALVMADVSGKGVPAALFMMVAKMLIRNRIQDGESPGQALGNVNNRLIRDNEAEMFVTVWLAVLEISTGKGIAVNAGHEHPVIRRADGEYELVVYHHSPAVAVMEDVSFREHEFELHPGDSLFVYTDGVAEATNTENELFGADRLLRVLNQAPDADPEKVLQNVMEGIDLFVGGAEQFDDITMLCLRYFGR